MSTPKVLVVGESPAGPMFHKYLMGPLASRHGLEVDYLPLLEGKPKNGKQATKTELRLAESKMEDIRRYRYVVLCGNSPLQFITGKAGIRDRRGKPFKDGRTFFLPVNTPNIIAYDPNQEALLDQDLRLLSDMVDFGGIPEERRLSIRVVEDWDDFEAMLLDLSGRVSFDIETNSLNPFQTHVDRGKKGREACPAKIVSLGFGTGRHQWVIPVSHRESSWNPEDIQLMVDKITEVLSEDRVELITHNGKFDMLWMYVHFGVKWEIHFDTMMAHYILDENMRHGLKFLAQFYLGAPDWEVSLEAKKGEQSLGVLVKYHSHDLFYTRELAPVFKKMLKKDPDVKRVFELLIMPVVNLFVEIEYDGVFINVDQFGEAEKALREQYQLALDALKKWEPKDSVDSKGQPMEFNWGSTQQLSWLLYKKLKLPVIESTPTGNPSCSESVIKRLNHPCTEALLKFREAKQQLSFFIDGWKPFLHKRPDGYYLHPSFKLHGTVTGRLSCENPNLQQVPRDKRIRTLVSAPEGWTLIECDLSQIELRIAAELAGERGMLHAFLNDIDVHWLTAIQEIARAGGLKSLVVSTAKTWLNTGKTPSYSEAIEALLKMGPDAAIEINPEWKEYRKKAKAINFGYLYGMWWKKFKDYARDNYGVIVTDEEAEGSREAFFENYADFPDWHDKQKRFVRKHGYVSTLTGRKRRLPAAKRADSDSERKAAERQAINSPVQSFANDINLMAALQLRSEFSRRVVRICGTVHDAVLFRVKNEYVPQVYSRMLEIMKRPKLMDDFDIRLSVPIEADGSIGPWGAGVSLDKWRGKK